MKGIAPPEEKQCTKKIIEPFAVQRRLMGIVTKLVPSTFNDTLLEDHNETPSPTYRSNNLRYFNNRNRNVTGPVSRHGAISGLSPHTGACILKMSLRHNTARDPKMVAPLRRRSRNIQSLYCTGATGIRQIDDPTEKQGKVPEKVAKAFPMISQSARSSVGALQRRVCTLL